ncbi:hypothetical protein H1R20_g4199, partial [Candolleomyces eurysporus]
MAPQRPGNQTGVNELLHRKRGEQFRHAQNVRNSRTHISSAHATIRNKPTLPINFTNLNLNDEEVYEPKKPEESSSRSPLKCSGPGPPKSWVAKLTTPQDLCATPSWRLDALSLLYSHLAASISTQRVIPLSVLCLLPLVTSCTISELRDAVLPFIPPHLRKEVVRYTAVHEPLSTSRLFLLYEQEGHADGEIIVVGPSTSIRDDYFIQSNQEPRPGGSSVPQPQGAPSDEEEEDWETEDNSPKLLQTFAAVSTRLSMSTILSLPPTITHLALIQISSSIALHRLPKACPLLIFLDLSYNEWLEYPTNETFKSLNRVDWSRWSHLRTLGWRKCVVPDGMLVKLNTGRWDEVNVVR